MKRKRESFEQRESFQFSEKIKLLEGLDQYAPKTEKRIEQWLQKCRPEHEISGNISLLNDDSDLKLPIFSLNKYLYSAIPTDPVPYITIKYSTSSKSYSIQSHCQWNESNSDSEESKSDSESSSDNNDQNMYFEYISEQKEDYEENNVSNSTDVSEISKDELSSGFRTNGNEKPEKCDYQCLCHRCFRRKDKFKKLKEQWSI